MSIELEEEVFTILHLLDLAEDTLRSGISSRTAKTEKSFLRSVRIARTQASVALERLRAVQRKLERGEEEQRQKVIVRKQAAKKISAKGKQKR